VREFSSTMIKMEMAKWTTKNLHLYFVVVKVATDHKRVQRVSDPTHLLNNNTIMDNHKDQKEQMLQNLSSYSEIKLRLEEPEELLVSKSYSL